ncbi:organic solute transporter Ostalpha-domain-containing protein [Dactylonectria estremocensis]|uniref:Organic solute transporter Ostalpha-domain-containing protein n=1 Tax=Dactylonectria estremocensis TaxID=1079267 RepID=A0A9P9JFM4_9HYPO|nr:organic solute transporter Ostalpha-domain-containing protein [Dactylonectria estremocensis]
MSPQCNATLEDMSVPDDQKAIVGNFTFAELARIIGSASTGIAVLVSLYLIWRHATNYTKPLEQRHIIRILFMVPVYSASSLLQIFFYEHAVYVEVISQCYEAFALAAFFALVCHYVAPDVRSQKAFFRGMRPIKPWIFPLSLFARCCGGQRGPWRTPASGLTWFNICWVSIYQYCFTRIAAGVIAVATEAAGRYCASSNSPAFAHIWVAAINMVAVTVAMVCVVQVYVQLKEALAEHRLFTKILAIKLVVFLVLWQTVLLSIGTSTVDSLKPSSTLSQGDIKVGISSLLVCVEMAFFAVFHLWAFPFRPYVPGAPVTFYPAPDPARAGPHAENKHQPPSGGPAGLGALVDAMNPWDLVKAVGRGVRWLFVGVRHRKQDVSYASAPVPLGFRPTSLDADRRGSQDSDAPLKPPGLGSSDDPLPPPPDYTRGDYPTPGDDRYEPMRTPRESTYPPIHISPPEPYDAGRTQMTSSPPQSYGPRDQRTNYSS